MKLMTDWTSSSKKFLFEVAIKLSLFKPLNLKLSAQKTKTISCYREEKKRLIFSFASVGLFLIIFSVFRPQNI